MAEALYLNIPTPSKLTETSEFLREAHALVTDAHAKRDPGAPLAACLRKPKPATLNF